MSQIEEVELGIDQAKIMIARAAALQKLFTNKDFKEVVLEGYFKEESVRMVMLKADPVTLNDEMQVSIDNGIIAIGQLNQYFKTVRFLGEHAAKSLQDYEEMHADLLAEGAE